MKVNKLNENLVHVLITKQDLDQQDLKFADFLKMNKKWQKFLDYLGDYSGITSQTEGQIVVRALPNFSHQKIDLFLATSMDITTNEFDINDMNSVLNWLSKDNDYEADDVNEVEDFIAGLSEALVDNGLDEEYEEVEELYQDSYLFELKSIEQLIYLVNENFRISFESEVILFKDKLYFLVHFKKNSKSKESMLALLNEYMLSSDEAIIYVLEHGKSLFGKNALNQIKKLFKTK